MNRKRLQAVLRVRSLQERGARGELALRSQAHQRASAAEEHTWQRLDEFTAGSAVTAGSSASGPGSDLAALQSVRHAGTLAAQRQRADTEATLEQTLVARDAWTVAARRVEALDRLGERLREVDEAEEERLQILEIDDLVLARRGRGPTGGAS